MTHEERFYEKVEMYDTGCWGWNGSFSTKKHVAIVFFNEQSKLAKKVSYELANNVVLPTHTKLITTCGDFHCLNPEHIIIRPNITPEYILTRQKACNSREKIKRALKKKARIKRPVEEYSKLFTKMPIKCVHMSDDMPFKLYRVSNIDNLILKKREYASSLDLSAQKQRDDYPEPNDFDLSVAKPFACFLYLDHAQMFGDMLYPKEYLILDETKDDVTENDKYMKTDI